MKFSDFIKEGSVRKTSPDDQLAKSLLNSSIKDIKFLNSLKINVNSSRKIMSNYYDVLRSILEAISALGGYKIYSHEAFTYYLKDRQEESLSRKFDRFRRIRNNINYYGIDISVEETKENIIEIDKMVKVLINKYLKGLK